MYVKERVWLSAQICFVLKWFWIVRPRSGSGYLYINEPQCDSARAFIRSDCTKSNTHEMPHARPRHGSVVRMHCGLGLPHLLAFEADWRRLGYVRIHCACHRVPRMCVQHRSQQCITGPPANKGNSRSASHGHLAISSIVTRKWQDLLNGRNTNVMPGQLWMLVVGLG